jgi:pimeloyl-ACP methyl ester carboxylesterase
VAIQKSTIVRSMRVLSTIAPAAAAVIAERWWCTVPRGRPAPATAPGEIHRLTVNGRMVVAEVWGDGPPIYLLHGWGGRRGQLDALVQPLAEAGHRVIAVDAPGHGDSAPGSFGPGRAVLPDFCDALRVASQTFGRAYAAVGHSLGGLAITVALLDGWPADRVVLIAPAPDTMAYTVDFARAFGFSEGVRRRFVKRLSRRVGRPMADFDVLARARETEVAPLPPMLVIHDRDDREVRWADGQALAAAWPHGTFAGTEGLGHGRILRDPEVISRVVKEIG